MSKLSDEKEGASKINKIVRKGKGTKHKAALFSIEDLVPEYYGKKHEWLSFLFISFIIILYRYYF